MWITDMQQKIEQEFVVFYIITFELVERKGTITKRVLVI